MRTRKPPRGNRERRPYPPKPPVEQPTPRTELVEYRDVFCPPVHRTPFIGRKHDRLVIENAHSKITRKLGISLMRCERWNPGPPTKNRLRGVPFIDKGGHISGSCVMNWRCSSTQWFATVLHSVFRRSKRRMSKGSIDERKRKSDDLIFKIAAYYVCTMDDTAFERLLCSYVRGTLKLLTYLVNKMDDRQRFLYGQATCSASCLWLRYRGCPPRVQSINKTILAHYRRFDLKIYDSVRERNSYLNSLCDPWIVGGLRYE